MSDHPLHSEQTDKIEHGAWPFISHIVYNKRTDEPVIWQSRHFRKGFLSTEKKTFISFHRKIWSGVWMPDTQNWWIGILFMVGASFFISGALLSLDEVLRHRFRLSTDSVNHLFFFGSIFFTSAAWLQLFQAANRGILTQNGTITATHFTLIGWQPKQVGWLSCFLQFLGTLLFNMNTLAGTFQNLNHSQSELLVWLPNFLGSIFFLLSGYLAFVETGHKHWSWQVKDLSWWLTFINLLGCISFMISAIYAVFPIHSLESLNGNLSLLFTLIGAACFWLGAFLLLPENAVPKTKRMNF